MSDTSTSRPIHLCRSWLFLPGADSQVHALARASAADALIVDLEDGTPAHLRPAAYRLFTQFVVDCRAAGKLACVRINPLEAGGRDDLAAVVGAWPDVVFLPKAESPAQIEALARTLSDEETRCAIGRPIAIVPNIETARGLIQTYAIASASPRAAACLVASEDLTNSLNAERGRDGVELAYARQRFLVECRAAGVMPIDCPYTFSDAEGLAVETRHARRLGYPAKSSVDVSQVAQINRLLTPEVVEVARARAIVLAFERAHAQGRRAEFDGNYLEVPIYTNARRLIARYEALVSA